MNRTALVVVSLFIAGACAKKEGPKALPPEVLVTAAVQQDVPVGIEAVGQTRGSEEVQIRPRVSGYLQSLNFTEGQPVKKGATLYVIDRRPFEATVAQLKGQLEKAQASLLKAKQDVERYTPLVAQKAVSKMELDNALAARDAANGSVASARGALQEAEVNLSYCTILAPTDGVAGISARSVGNLVGPSDPDPLTTISKVDPIWVKVSIPEAQYLELARKVAARPKGDTTRRPIEMVLADGSVFPQPGKFRAMDARTDATTGTVSIDIQFPNPERILRAGQFARIRSLQELQGLQRIAVVGAGDTVHLRTIKTGPHSGNLVVVTEGVQVGDRVVVEGLQRIREGIVVRAEPAPPPVDSTPGPAPSGAAPAAGASAVPPAAPESAAKTPR